MKDNRVGSRLVHNVLQLSWSVEESHTGLEWLWCEWDDFVPFLGELYLSHNSCMHINPYLFFWPLKMGTIWQSYHSLCVTALALLYELKVPRWDFQTGRQLRTSPLYDRLDTQGARWMEKHGFERAKFFVPPGKGKRQSLSRSLLLPCPQIWNISQIISPMDYERYFRA